MPLHSSITDQVPLGMTKFWPSRYTGTPEDCSAPTVKSAVHSIIHGSANSPKGTARNRNSSGNRIVRATASPSTAGTASTSVATKANWVAALTATSSAISQAADTASSGSSSQSCGRGASAASSARLRHTSHSASGGTSMQWAKVSERHQTSAIASAVSR